MDAGIYIMVTLANMLLQHFVATVHKNGKFAANAVN